MFLMSSNVNSEKVNHPKYVILLKYASHWIGKNDIFHYLVSAFVCFYDEDTFPIYLISFNLFFDTETKFHLNKLGKNYIINSMCSHSRNECIGSYPKNYIFVVEPHREIRNVMGVDRTSLKKI